MELHDCSNLSCDHYYLYEMADQPRRDKPVVMGRGNRPPGDCTGYMDGTLPGGFAVAAERRGVRFALYRPGAHG